MKIIRLLNFKIYLGVLISALLFSFIRVSQVPNEKYPPMELPYYLDFEHLSIHRWISDKNDWFLQDGKLINQNNTLQDGQLFIPLLLPEDQPYQIHVQISMPEIGQTVGLNFNAQIQNVFYNHHRVSISRVGESISLETGTVDEVSGFQSRSNVLIDFTEDTLWLDIGVDKDTYWVKLNGILYVEEQNTVYKDGLMGFVNSGGFSSFDNLRVLVEGKDVQYMESSNADILNIDQNYYIGDVLYQNRFDALDEENGWVLISGNWQSDNGVILQLDPNAVNASIAYEEDRFQHFSIDVTLSHLSDTGGGILFNMKTPYQLAGSHIFRYSNTSDGILWGYYDDNGRYIGQGYAPIPSPGNTPHQISVSSRETVYSVYVDGELFVDNVPLQNNNGYIGLTTDRSAVVFESVEIYSLNGEENDDFKLPATGSQSLESNQIRSFDFQSEENIIEWELEGNWLPIEGNWQVLDDNLFQNDPSGFDLGIGYSGREYQSYTIQTVVEHLQGSGAGILFHMTTPSSLNGAYMVRYSNNGNGLFWGYFAENGEFIGQGHAKLDLQSFKKYRIRLEVQDHDYRIFIDDQLIALEVPLAKQYGFIGLIASESTVVFSELEITETEIVISGGDRLNDEYLVINGNWDVTESGIRQTDVAATDFVLNLGYVQGSYSLETKVDFSQTPDSLNIGGGVIINMSEPRSKKNSNMVRLTPGGLFWGYYDEEEVFNGQGWANSLGEGQARSLQIVVQNQTYSIFINGIQVASEIHLINDEGYIGLLAYGGLVGFEEIELFSDEDN